MTVLDRYDKVYDERGVLEASKLNEQVTFHADKFREAMELSDAIRLTVEIVRTQLAEDESAILRLRLRMVSRRRAPKSCPPSKVSAGL